MAIQRWDQVSRYVGWDFLETSDGSWVKYDDHLTALREQRDKFIAMLQASANETEYAPVVAWATLLIGKLREEEEA